MKVVITGASGFLGKNLINHLADFKISFARLLDLHFNESESHISIPSDQHEIDLVNPALNDLIEKDDVVIHLAWKSNPAVTGADIDAEAKLNWDASENLIRTCSLKGAKLVFTSSGGTVYGHPEYVPTDESHPTHPISAYGMMKLKVEEAIIQSHKRDGLRYLILRPSNLYGPGFSLQKGLGVIGHWVDVVRQNGSIKMVGDGLLTRDFIHTDDLCRGIMSALYIENEILNIGSGIGVSLKGLQATFEDILNRPLDVTHLEDRQFDVKVNVLSIEKIQRMTNWIPTISLEEGIRQLLD